MILISGPEAGVPFAMSDLRAAKQAAPQTPVLANTGVTADRLAEILAVADGVIVGTSLKVDGITWNPVDPARARRFMDTARQVRSAPARGQLTWPPVEAVVLDMDGVLIDTEPVWRAAESDVFAGLGIALSESDLLDSTGQPIEELIPVWRRRPRLAPAGRARA